MLTRSLVVARKEIRDHARDRRALASAALSALMGPAVVLIVLIATGPASAEAKGRSWVTMAAVFALMSGFTGAMTSPRISSPASASAGRSCHCW